MRCGVIVGAEESLKALELDQQIEEEQLANQLQHSINLAAARWGENSGDISLRHHQLHFLCCGSMIIKLEACCPLRLSPNVRPH